ncbi:MFS multidrug transporter [Hyaloscypha variabilis F]|uniref:MFS multidrug transporter n=1 Tax=Hyaloscypha variabilis (strain UAMH 11265 / GT02V1 / F) TaxID=1149755 RepID=A0A2J6RNT7_HYAVF|nr:MFS multidrug transporter [Hyaloscypha variabilis F]
MNPRIDAIDRDILEAERWAEEEISPNQTLRQDHSYHSPSPRPEGDRSRTRSGRTVRTLEPVELNRIHTYRLQHSGTVGSARTGVPKENWLELGAGKPYPPSLPDAEEYVVEFVGPDDPLHPHNWSFGRKIAISAILTYSTFVASFASAIFSAAIRAVDTEFHFSIEVGTLGVTLYVLGFASGPTLWAPMSELSGRRLPLIIGLFGYSVFSIASATAKDTQTLMLTRFFSGFFSASPLSIVPACFADLYDNRSRGIAISIFAMAVFVGPFASPFTGGFITMSYLGWRWTMYISSIMGWLAFGLTLLFVKETYAPAILVSKAATLRRQTRNWGIHAKQDEVELDLHELLTTNFSRPLRMLFTEPIVMAVTVYMSFIYGLMYALLDAYPIVFQEIHGMNEGVGGLPFIGLIVGEFAGGLYILWGQKEYVRKLVANGGVPVPEWRLWPAVVGGVFFTIGLFWFGWTGYTRSIHWIAPTLSGLFVGFGILCIFLQCFNYLIDSYLQFAASVFAANTILRSVIGGCFPLFARQMFLNMGVQWAGTLLGCLSLIMIPIPFGFIVYGKRLRGMSRYQPVEKAVKRVSNGSSGTEVVKEEV